MSVGALVVAWVAFFGCVTAVLSSHREHTASELDGSPFRECPNCHQTWSLASYRNGPDLCFRCVDAAKEVA